MSEVKKEKEVKMVSDAQVKKMEKLQKEGKVDTSITAEQMKAMTAQEAYNIIALTQPDPTTLKATAKQQTFASEVQKALSSMGDKTPKGYKEAPAPFANSAEAKKYINTGLFLARVNKVKVESTLSKKDQAVEMAPVPDAVDGPTLL